MERRAFLARATAVGGFVGLAGCGAFAGERTLAESDYDVGMAVNAFRPAAVEVAAGDTVVWGNDGSRVHTVTACDAGERDTVAYCDGRGIPSSATYFASGGYTSEAAALEAWPDGGAVSAGEAYAHTFETPGEYPYYCIPHEPAGMVGTVVVTE